MTTKCISEEVVISASVRAALAKELKTNSERCIECKLCVIECAFLQRYGTPKTIADSYDPREGSLSMPFECSLCGLCSAVCPVNIDPSRMFLEMRRETVRLGAGDYPEHSALLAYERRGTSRRYTYYAIPIGCDTVFFPGCALPGTRPDKVSKLFEYLKRHIPALGVVLDCCTKPSHDLGWERHFNAMFGEMKEFLVRNGIEKVLVACPNCYKVFKEFGGNFAVSTIYEVMAEKGLPEAGKVGGVVTVHDPCPLRYEESVHGAVRFLIAEKGLAVEEMPHSSTETLCCGEGGAVGFLSPGLSRRWAAIRKEEASGRRIITYCAGCTNLLGAITPASHILDLIFEPEATMAGKAKVSKSPMTYRNRLRLKNALKKRIDATITRERTFTAGEPEKKGIIRFFGRSSARMV